MSIGVYRWLIFSLLVGVLAGCSNPTAVTPIATQPPTETVAASLPAATATARPQPTLVVESPTAVSTPTLIPSPTTASFASQLPGAETASWQVAASGLAFPIAVMGAGDDSGRLFIVSQSGQIFILKDGALMPEPFLDIRSLVTAPRGDYYGERSLLGMAFHPRYAENGYFYLNYTNRDGDTRIVRYQTLAGNPDRADPASEQLLLFVRQPYANHNGGGLAFGPDGYLYIGLGDGGSANDPQKRGQALDTHLGKLLRIDVDAAVGTLPYAIPATNPFAAGPVGALPEIWAYGLRNPWRFSFDRLTGDLYIGDVGQGSYEEIDFLPTGSPGGSNFGWNFREGLHEFQGSPPLTASFVDPVAEYSHAQGCSVTGGVVVRDPLLPEWQGVYLYGDYCSGNIWGLLRTDGNQSAWQNAMLFQTGFNITSFGEDDTGGVYVTDYQAGVVYRLR